MISASSVCEQPRKLNKKGGWHDSVWKPVEVGVFRVKRDQMGNFSVSFEPDGLRGSGQGKIAVEVINHYGDEVLKVFDV